MSRLYVPRASPLDNSFGLNRRPPDALAMRLAMHTLAAIGAGHHRTLFSQHVLGGTTSAAPLWLFRYRESNNNGRRVRYTMSLLPPYAAEPAAGTAMPRLETSIGAVFRYAAVNATQVDPNDLRMGFIEEDLPVGPSGNYEARSVSTFNGGLGDPFRIAVLSIHEIPTETYGVIETTWGGSVNHGRVRTLVPIQTGPVSAFQLALEHVWMNQRPVVAAWSANGTANAAARQVTTTTLTNLLDLSSTGVTATTPGEVCPVQNAGRGLATTVEAQVAVYAAVSAGTNGTVRFDAGSNGVSLSISTVAGWVTSATSLLLDTNVEYDKVDVLGSAGTAGETIRAWAWSIQIHPV